MEREVRIKERAGGRKEVKKREILKKKRKEE